MKRVIDTSEVLGTVETPEGPQEVCASAEAAFDEDSTRLVVKLDAFLRAMNLLTKERLVSADWLPRPETVRERVDADEAAEMARDIFHRWTRKVREAMPVSSRQEQKG